MRVATLLSMASGALAGLPEGWRFASMLPQGNDLNAGWVDPAGRLHVGGEGGVILLWDGTGWEVQPTPTQETLFAMHGTSPSDIWAVGGDAYAEDPGDRSLILHFDGTQWVEVPAPDFLGHRYVLNGVCALAPDDAWATLDGSTRPIHFDGVRWDWADPAPEVWAQLEGSLKGVGAVDAGHVFFFGTHGQIVHRAGDQWALEQKTESGGFTVNLLQCIWAPALDGVLIGGNFGQVYRRNADGTWTDLGQGPAQGSNLLHIWGRGPGEIYMMGGDFIRRFDGSGTPEVLQMAGRVDGAWKGGFGTGDLLYGFGRGRVHAFQPDAGDGVVSFLTTGGGAVPYSQIDGLVPLAGDAMIGWGDTSYVDADPLFVVDASGFSRFPSRPPGMLQRTRITAVQAGGRDDIVVCWNNWSQPGQGVHRWNGSEWLPMMDGAFDPQSGFTYPPVHAHALWRAPSGEIVAVESNRVLRSDAAGVWHTLLEIPFDQDPPRTLTAVWGRSLSEVYVGTGQGVILRHDGSAFTEESVPGGRPVRALGGDAVSVYAAGTDGGIWRREGPAWIPVSGVMEREGDDFTAIVAGRDGVYAHQQTPSRYIGGGLGRLWKLDGTQARRWIAGMSGGNDAVLGTDGDGYVHVVRGADHWVTDRPAPDGLTLRRVDRAGSPWIPLAESGVELSPGEGGAGFAMVAAWRVAGDPPGAVALPSGGDWVAPSRWVIRQEQWRTGSALPDARIRIHLPPPGFPPGTSETGVRLARFDGFGWTVSAAEADPGTGTVTARGPGAFGVWAVLAAAGPGEEWLLEIARLASGLVRVAWPASATGVVLESSPALGESADWQPVTTASREEGDRRQVDLPPGETVRFFRLR